MNTEQKFGLVNQQFGIIYDAIKNTQADVNYLSANNPELDQLSDVNINSAVNGDTLVYNSTTSEWVNSATTAEVPLTFSTGLTRTTNTITNNLSTGVVGGQTAIGGTGITDILTLKGTTGNGTSGSPAIQAIVGNNGATTALTVLNSGNVGIGTTTPAYPLDVNGSAKFTTIRDSADSLGTAGQVLSSTSSALSWITPFALPTLTGLSGDAIVSDGSGNIKVSITGNNNYSSGATAFISRTSGTQSTAVGVEALRLNTSGNSNVAVGFQALKSNLGGFNNVAVGTLALVNNTGNTNTSIGHHSLFNNTSGSNNSAIGTDAGKFIADGTSANSTGSNSVFLGASTKSNIAGQTNQIVIGYDAIGNGTNSITLGNSLITKTIIPYGNVGIGTTAPTNILSLGNASAQKFWIENTATDVSGRALTVAAGGTVAGTSVSNVSGGQLILQSGSGTGTGDSSIAFQTATTLTTGTTLQTMSTKMTILGNGNVGINEPAPSAMLHLSNTGPVANSTIVLENFGFGNSLQGKFGSGTSSAKGFPTNGQGLLSINVQGWNTTTSAFTGSKATFSMVAAEAWSNTANGTNIRFSTTLNTTTTQAEKMRLTDAGYLGIGTTAPTNILSLGNASAQKIWIENTATDVSGRALTVAAGGTVAGTSVSDVSGGQLILQSGSGTGTGDSSIAFQTATTLTTGTTLQTMSTKMTILGNGNVGIGTPTPSVKLQVVGGANTTLLVGSNDTAAVYMGVKTSGSSGLGYFGVEGSTPASITTGTLAYATVLTGAASGSALQFGTAGGVRQTILANGNVGIGTTAPTKLLTVVGGDALINTVTVGLGTGSISDNTCLGNIALNATPTGGGNTAIGYAALNANSSGTNNTAIGGAAGSAINTGGNNTIIGYSAGSGVTTGSWNTFIGRGAGNTLTTGSNNIYLGGGSAASAVGVSNEVAIGYAVTGNGSNTITLGNSSITKTIIPYGSVGIGMTAPDYKLDINSTATYKTLMLRANAIGTRFDVALEFNAVNVLTSPYARIGLQVTSASSGSEVAGLTFWTINNSVLSEKMCITAGGNVGIGTTAPVGKFNVENAVASTVLGDNYWIRLSGGGGTTNQYQQIGMGYVALSSNSPVIIGSRTVLQTDKTTAAFFVATRSVTTDTAPTERLVVDATGKVGIGTPTPSVKLQVLGDTGYPATSGTTQTGVFRVSGGSGLYNVIDMGVNESTDTAWIQATRANSLGTYDKLLINPYGGNVGIGTGTTTLPGAKLDVAGSGEAIRLSGSGTGANSMRVISTGADTYFGAEGSVAGGFFTGSLAYSTVVYSGTSIQNIIGGVPRMIINTSGNIGIGTTAPTYLLDLQKTRTIQLTLVRLGTDNAPTATGDEVSIDFSSNNNTYMNARISRYIEDFTTYTGGLKFYTGTASINATPAMTIMNAGKVLIGTTTAAVSEKLRISGNVGSNSPSVAFTSATSNISASSAVATTIYTFPSQARVIFYEVFVRLDTGADATNYAAMTTIAVSSDCRQMSVVNGGLLVLTVSGFNLQATQTSGATQNVMASVRQTFATSGF